MQRPLVQFLALSALFVITTFTSGCHVVQQKISIPFVAEVVRTDVIPIGAKRGVTSYRISWNPVFLSVAAFGGVAAAVLVPAWLAMRGLRRRRKLEPLTAIVLPDGSAVR
jgi:hypothetical protein